MRDVIVIGAGGGGPVVAKELAARGLDVLLLEAGPRHAKPREEWTHFENDANNPLTGYFRFGPDRPGQAGLVPRDAAELVRLAALRRRRHDAALLRQLPAGVRRASSSVTTAPTRTTYDIDAPVPVHATASSSRTTSGSRPRCRCRRRRWARKEEIFFRGAETLGLPVQTTQGHDPRRRTGRRRTRSCSPAATAGKTADTDLLRVPAGDRLHVLRLLLPGLHASRMSAPRNLKFAKRSTDNSYVPMALTADVWTPGGKRGRR